MDIFIQDTILRGYIVFFRIRCLFDTTLSDLSNIIWSEYYTIFLRVCYVILCRLQRTYIKLSSENNYNCQIQQPKNNFYKTPCTFILAKRKTEIKLNGFFESPKMFFS